MSPTLSHILRTLRTSLTQQRSGEFPETFPFVVMPRYRTLLKKMEFYNPGSGINIHFRIVNILSFPFSNFTKRELNFPKRFSK